MKIKTADEMKKITNNAKRYRCNRNMKIIFSIIEEHANKGELGVCIYNYMPVVIGLFDYYTCSLKLLDTVKQNEDVFKERGYIITYSEKGNSVVISWD